MCLMTFIVLSSMTRHRFIHSFMMFGTPAALWHKPNFTEMEKWGSEKQPRLSDMTDGLEEIL